MNVFKKGNVISWAYGIGGAALSSVGLFLMVRSSRIKGMIDGTRGAVMAMKVKELEGSYHNPLYDYFDENIEI